MTFARPPKVAWLLLVIWPCAPAVAQQFRVWQVVEFSEEVQVDEADHVARSHLETIERFLDADQWDEAIEALQRLMDTDGDTLLALRSRRGADLRAGEFLRYVSLRDYCQMRLASLYGRSDQALEQYRAQVDSLAESWLREATARDDAGPLRRVIARFFVSSYGDRALYQLGEMKLAQGRFTHARAAWERISPELRIGPELARQAGLFPGLPLWLAHRIVPTDQTLEASPEEASARILDALPPEGAWLAYPDADLDLADVRARLILVSILEGSLTRAELEWEYFGRLHPTAEGTLGGRQGPYVELLGDLLEQSRSWEPIPPPADWATFGGAASRGKIATGRIDVALRPLWVVDLPRQTCEAQWIDGVTRPGESRQGLLSYHPLVVDDKVLLATGDRIEDVQAFDLHTGRSLWPSTDLTEPTRADSGGFAPAGQEPRFGPGLQLRPGPQQRHGVARYTMTAAGNRLFVKLGTQATSVVPSHRFDPTSPGYLVALDLEAEKRRMFELHLEPEIWGDGWAFEGAPLIDGENLYVILRRRENLRTQSHVACFVMRRHRAELRWRTRIVTAESPAQGELDEYTHNLLTLDQGALYVNTNLGAVASLDTDDGRLRWLVRYSRAPLTSQDFERTGRYLLRDLNPCLVDRDTVYTAPSDSDRIFALDAATGMLLWQTAPGHAEDAVHLLGVNATHLLASGDRIYWIDRYTGNVHGRFPERVETDLRGYGRGVMVGQELLWPTRDRIYVLAQDGPRSVRQPIELAPIGMTGGNLVPAGDVLLVAGADRLAAYNPWGYHNKKAEP